MDLLEFMMLLCASSLAATAAIEPYHLRSKLVWLLGWLVAFLLGIAVADTYLTAFATFMKG